MRSKIALLFLVIILVGVGVSCLIKEKKHESVYSLIEENENYVISIHYPITTIKAIDDEVEVVVEGDHKQFLKGVKKKSYLIDRDELNIDYSYFRINDRFYNVVIKVYMYNGDSKKITNYVQSYMFDRKQGRFISVDDIVSDKGDLLSKVNKQLLGSNKEILSNLSGFSFSFSNSKLYMYYVDDEIRELEMDLDQLELKIRIINDRKKATMVSSSNIITIDPSKPVVAITFDDGPSYYTEGIVNTLKKYNANATFFVLGNKVEAYQDVVRLSIQNGNEIGNHSYNHKWLSRLSTKEIIRQIERTQDILKSTVGYTPTCLRPTYGSINNRIRKNTDLDIVLWTIDTKDWKIYDVDRIVDKVIRNVEDGDIILMHDIFQRTEKALEKIIPLLQKEGYQFVTISELKEIKLLRSEMQ